MEKNGNNHNKLHGIILDSVILFKKRRGFSLIFGHWPSDIDLAIKIKKGQSIFDDDGDAFILYLFIMASINSYIKFWLFMAIKNKLTKN